MLVKFIHHRRFAFLSSLSFLSLSLARAQKEEERDTQKRTRESAHVHTRTRAQRRARARGKPNQNHILSFTFITQTSESIIHRHLRDFVRVGTRFPSCAAALAYLATRVPAVYLKEEQRHVLKI